MRLTSTPWWSSCPGKHPNKSMNILSLSVCPFFFYFLFFFFFFYPLAPVSLSRSVSFSTHPLTRSLAYLNSTFTLLRTLNQLHPPFFSLCRASRSLSQGIPSAQHEKMLCETWCVEVRSPVQTRYIECKREIICVFEDVSGVSPASPGSTLVSPIQKDVLIATSYWQKHLDELFLRCRR